MADFEQVEAGGESIVNEDRANEILDALAGLTTMQSDPPGLIDKIERAERKATMVFATERVIWVKDGIPTFFDAVAVDAGTAVDDDPL